MIPTTKSPKNYFRKACHKATASMWMLMTGLLMTLTAQAEHFSTLNVKGGLADNFVRDIMTDSEGYVWLSTINGVSRYDGYRFLNFQPQQWGSPTGDVAMVRETADRTLWMLCTNELFTYQRPMRIWQKDGTERLSVIGVKGNNVSEFYIDGSGNLWVATERGLYHYDYAEGRLHDIDCRGLAPILHIVAKNGTTLIITTDFKIYKVVVGTATSRLSFLTAHPSPVTDDRDSRVLMDSRMNLWVYQAHALAGSQWVYSLSTGQWHQADELRLMGNDVTVNVMAEDHEGNLWVGTGNRGIHVFSGPGSESHRLVSAFTPMSSHITCFLLDRNNIMWVGSAKLGAAYTDLNSLDFNHVSTGSCEDVSALMEDRQGNLWIGFDGQGILRKDKSGGTTSFTALQGQLPSNIITSMAIDGSGQILVGTYGNGIARFDGRRFMPLYPDYDPLRYVKAMISDRHGSLWVATVDKGVVRITANGRFTNYTSSNSPLVSNGILCLVYDDSRDVVYIGTSTGVSVYDCGRDAFIDKGVARLNGSYVTALLVDDDKRLWIGSRGGLWIYDSDSICHLTTDQGLSHNVVRALAKSADGVWASTDNGLTFVHAVAPGLMNVQCQPFFDSDGLYNVAFSNNAALTARDGTVLLGCFTGYISIPPSTIHHPLSTLHPLQVRFTDFRINGKDSEGSLENFTIRYGERPTIFVSAMLPALNRKIRYSYRFKGDKEWVHSPSNSLYFVALNPGRHVLQVKAEQPGITSDDEALVAELPITVLAPIWLSTPAILVYLALLIGAVWLLTRAVRRRQKREVAMKQMEINLRKYEMEEDKIRFFTNISHDLKTPLTLVLAPLEKIREHNLPEAIRTEIDVAWRNARQLYDLVLELLDFRRLDVGKEKLNLGHGDLVSFVRQTAQGFAYYTTRKFIDLRLELPPTSFETQFDENKMRRIITNLMSNAYKYNIDGGSVTVSLDVQEKEVKLSVADTGIGVKDKHHIFDRFVQETHGQEQEGSGLGLHIVRQYVNMMGGNITVRDNQPRGTVFTVALPVAETDIETKAEEVSDTQSTMIPTILVVEDNTDARLFLQRSLDGEYHVLTAPNGKEALNQLVKADGVSIIISDVMMPVMDGIQLVRQLRKNIRYSHIPVILLTAKSSEEDIVAGLKEGVDEYLTKPYSLAVLRLRIRKILEWTQHVHEQVATGIDINPSEITVSSLDEELVSHVISEVEANIGNPNYSVVELSAAVGMTRGTLYKKLMAITGKSPVEFIRIVRLKRGWDLLSQGRTNVSEVADQVGMSPKMFAQYFREMYSETPSDYLKRQRTITNKNKRELYT